jgi:hypothetical protein
VDGLFEWKVIEGVSLLYEADELTVRACLWLIKSSRMEPLQIPADRARLGEVWPSSSSSTGTRSPPLGDHLGAPLNRL